MIAHLSAGSARLPPRGCPKRELRRCSAPRRELGNQLQCTVRVRSVPDLMRSGTEPAPLDERRPTMPASRECAWPSSSALKILGYATPLGGPPVAQGRWGSAPNPEVSRFTARRADRRSAAPSGKGPPPVVPRSVEDPVPALERGDELARGSYGLPRSAQLGLTAPRRGLPATEPISGFAQNQKRFFRVQSG